MQGVRALPALQARRLLVGAGLILLALLWANYATTIGWPVFAGVDNRAYWSAWQGAGLYAPTAQVGEATYIYSPAFAQLLWPLTLLPWEAFRWLWIVASCAAMVWLLWPLGGALRWMAIVLACYFCLNAKADWLIALAVGLGFRYPAAWSLALLTKVTPGIGLLWYAVRREWRQLAVALGATLAIAALSFALAPGLWSGWLGVLARSTGHAAHGEILGFGIPTLFLRLPLAALLVAWGALGGRTWTLAVAAWIASPDLWVETVVILAAIPRLGRALPAGPVEDPDGDRSLAFRLRRSAPDDTREDSPLERNEPRLTEPDRVRVVDLHPGDRHRRGRVLKRDPREVMRALVEHDRLVEVRPPRCRVDPVVRRRAA